jgi:hypothetical protein
MSCPSPLESRGFRTPCRQIVASRGKKRDPLQTASRVLRVFAKNWPTPLGWAVEPPRRDGSHHSRRFRPRDGERVSRSRKEGGELIATHRLDLFLPRLRVDDETESARLSEQRELARGLDIAFPAGADAEGR